MTAPKIKCPICIESLKRARPSEATAFGQQWVHEIYSLQGKPWHLPYERE